MDGKKERQFKQKCRDAERNVDEVVNIVKLAVASWRMMPNSYDNWSFGIEWGFDQIFF